MNDKNETPIVAHQSSQECSHKEQTDPVSSVLSKDDSNSNAEDFAALDLLSCESISYEMRQSLRLELHSTVSCKGSVVILLLIGYVCC